jgi:glycosyltransferase involved in cell wall biosynthesis
VSVDPEAQRASGVAVLVQPAPGGRLSGGFLYNRYMADHGLWTLVDASAEKLADVVGHLSPSVGGQLLLADSIWLTGRDSAFFLAARERGWRLGTVLHSLPSLIGATESGLRSPGTPSAAELRLLANMDLVVLVGPHFRQLVESLGTPSVVCSPGISDEFRATPRTRRGRCKLLSLGTQSPRKGYLDVATVLCRLDPSTYHWTIVGNADVDTAYSSRLRAAVTELPVTLAGQRQPHDVAQLLKEADVFLMPSYDENHPLVVLEAIAASVPTIAYDAGAVQQMIEPPKRGLVVSIGNLEQLERGLRQLIGDEAIRRAMAERCFQHQNQLPTWQEAARVGRTALHSTLGKRERPTAAV